MFVDEVVLRVASGLDIASLSHARQRHQECNGITTTELTMKKVSRAMSRALEARCEMRPPSRVNDTYSGPGSAGVLQSPVVWPPDRSPARVRCGHIGNGIACFRQTEYRRIRASCLSCIYRVQYSYIIPERRTRYKKRISRGIIQPRF